LAKSFPENLTPLLYNKDLHSKISSTTRESVTLLHLSVSEWKIICFVRTLYKHLVHCKMAARVQNYVDEEQTRLNSINVHCSILCLPVSYENIHITNKTYKTIICLSFPVSVNSMSEPKGWTSIKGEWEQRDVGYIAI
jgi:hypothetical protein